MEKRVFLKANHALAILLLGMLLLGGCMPAGIPIDGEPHLQTTNNSRLEEASHTVIEVPEIKDGRFNVAFVYVGPIGDGGWTYAHNEGRVFLEMKL